MTELEAATKRLEAALEAVIEAQRQWSEAQGDPNALRRAVEVARERLREARAHLTEVETLLMGASVRPDRSD